VLESPRDYPSKKPRTNIARGVESGRSLLLGQWLPLKQSLGLLTRRLTVTLPASPFGARGRQSRE
jgi:hypothetical protein